MAVVITDTILIVDVGIRVRVRAQKINGVGVEVLLPSIGALIANLSLSAKEQLRQKL